MTLPAYEKLGVFYLGRECDPTRSSWATKLLYDSRDLTTHAVCIGMTGSGKTGLCLSLLEEAALDGIPAIAIDPKGDIANLALTFPGLRPEDFKPVGRCRAKRHARASPSTSLPRRRPKPGARGSSEWGEDGARIQRLRDAASVDDLYARFDVGAAAVDPAFAQRTGCRRPLAMRPRSRNASARRSRACSACSVSTPTRSAAANSCCSRRCSMPPGARARASTSPR